MVERMVDRDNSMEFICLFVCLFVSLDLFGLNKMFDLYFISY